jgi:hypothetical protein
MNSLDPPRCPVIYAKSHYPELVYEKVDSHTIVPGYQTESLVIVTLNFEFVEVWLRLLRH